MDERLTTFGALHGSTGPLVLPNAWDVVSAKIFEKAGFPAVGTTSAGIAASLGFADGECIPWMMMWASIGRIAQAVTVPVTADCEGGYLDQIEVPRLVDDLQAAHVCGINLEDGLARPATSLRDMQDQCHRLESVRRYADRQQYPLWINARTDAYWHPVGNPDVCFTEAVRRARAYRDSGADSLFIPGVNDPQVIARLVDAIGAPLNILAGPGSPPVTVLVALGVRRISLGSAPFRATAWLIQRMAAELRDAGTYELLAAPTMRYEDLLALLDEAPDSVHRS